MQDQIMELLIEKDDVSWQSILNELVRTEKMDPWDIDVSHLTHKYIETIKNLKKADFRLSGKVLLAAAILLKFKSIKLVNSDIGEFDRLIQGEEEFNEEDLYDSLEEDIYEEGEKELLQLYPRTPQLRKRKVSIFDLVGALRKALEVKKRRLMRQDPPDFERPVKQREMSLVINDVFGRISDFFSSKKGEKLYFSGLLKDKSREEKIFTFVPLLHLTNGRKIDLEQENHFEDIEIKLYNGEPVKEELIAVK